MIKHSLGDESQQFKTLLDRVLSVSKEEILKREAEYRAKSEANPHRRGRKRKAIKPVASPDPDA
jgi:hypothetical protein